jgi:integrase
MTSVTSETANRHTTRHHHRESPALGTARQNRYTDPLHTASADRRHSAATRWLRDGVPIEVVSALLGHSSVSVTSSVYGHLTAEDARAALEKAGWFTGKEVSW